MSRKSVLAVGVTLTTLAVVGATWPSADKAPSHAARRKARSSAPVGHATVSPYRRPVVRVGPPGSADRLLYEFALSYGNIAVSAAHQRNAVLLSMAGAPLANELRRAAPTVGLQIERGLPPGARIQSQVVSLAFGVKTARMQRAAIVLAERLRRSDGTLELPVEMAFVATVSRAGNQWWVTKFTPVP